jgi:hypothetical protein
VDGGKDAANHVNSMSVNDILTVRCLTRLVPAQLRDVTVTNYFVGRTPLKRSG